MKQHFWDIDPHCTEDCHKLPTDMSKGTALTHSLAHKTDSNEPIDDDKKKKEAHTHAIFDRLEVGSLEAGDQSLQSRAAAAGGKGPQVDGGFDPAPSTGRPSATLPTSANLQNRNMQARSEMLALAGTYTYYGRTNGYYFLVATHKQGEAQTENQNHARAGKNVCPIVPSPNTFDFW